MQHRLLKWESFQKLEPWLFYSLLIAGLFPVLIPKYFFNLDGASHLYNAGLIKDLLWGDNQTVRDFFVLNEMPVPNWMGHIIMAVSLLFAPDYIALKVFLLIYLALTPIFFRSFILSVSLQNKVFSVFMIIMVHNGLFYLGSYNMSIALTFSFAALAYFNRHCKEIKLWNTVALFFILLAVYFSHLLIFMVTVVLLGLLAVSTLSIERNGAFTLNGWKRVLTRIAMIVIAGLPGIVLTANYILKVDSMEGSASVIPFADAVLWLANLRSLGAAAYIFKSIDCRHVLVGLFLFLFAVNLIQFFKKRSKQKGEKTFSISIPQLWFALIIGVLYLYFTLPNANIISERLSFLFFILLITALAMLKYPKWVHVLTICVLAMVHYQYVQLNTKDMIHLTTKAKMIKEEAGDKIEDGGIVLALDYENYWLYVHANNYLAGGRPIVILDNYEAHLKWFPINWNYTKCNLEHIEGLVPDNSWATCKFYCNAEYPNAFSVKAKDGSSTVIEYVYVQGNNYNREDECHLRIQAIIAQGYDLLVENEFCRLYRLK